MRATLCIISLQEAIVMARLKIDILHFTGNVHFYEVGNKYTDMI